MSRSNALYLHGRERKYVGGEAWNRAFPTGASGVSTPLPDGVNLGDGYIPPSGGPPTSGTGGNPYIDPATGKPYPGAPGK
ncbi:MAG: hypothetical protein ACJ8R9_02515 [Steroidobacteraceae bacterium]